MNKIYFLKPNTSYHKDVLREILKIIKESNRLLFCISYFTHVPIAQEIIKRVKSGKETYMILNTHDLLRPNGPNSSVIKVTAAMLLIFENLGSVYEREKKINHVGDSDELENQLKVRLVGRDSTNDALQSIMHQKFIVGDDIIAFGSLNYTKNAFENNFENIYFTDDKKTVHEFKKEFFELWERGENFWAQNGKIRSVACPICRIEGSVDFESYGALCTNCNHKFKKTDFDE